MSKKSVDEIWKELNKRPAPRVAGSGLPGVTSITRVLPAGAVTDAAAASAKLSSLLSADAAAPAVEDVPLGSSGSSRRPPVVQYDLDKAGVSSDELQAYLSGGVQRLINCLSDPDRVTRRDAVQRLQARLLQGDAAAGAAAASPQLLQAILCGPLLYPLVGLLGDPFERCRLVAGQLLLVAMQRLADVAPLVPVMVPELARRMGSLPVTEPAEEVRLQLVELVAALVQQAGAGLLATCTGDLSLVLCRGLEDTFHEIKKAACGAVVALAATVPPAALQPHSERLLQALIANLTHQHSRVRTACLSAMDALLSRGVVPAGLVETLVAPGVRPVAYDRAPAVREALFTALAHWLVGASETAGGTASSTADDQSGLAAAYAPALLPILLVGVTDPQPSTAQQVLKLVESVGDAWAASRGGATSGSGRQDEAKQAAATSSSPEGRAASVDMSEGDPLASPAVAGSSAADGAAAAAQASSSYPTLPAPYSGRPGPGCCAMARALLRELLPPLIKELSEWTVSIRAAAARSLHTTLVLAEDAVVPHLPALLPALCGAVGDDDVEIAACIVRCVHVVGAHVPPGRALPLLLDHLTGPRLSTGQRASTLVVLSGLLHATARAKQTVPEATLALLAATLTSDDVRGTDHPAIRSQLLTVTQNLLLCAASAGQSLAPVSLPLALLLLHLYGLEKDAAALAAIGGVMAQLSELCGLTSFQELADSHADQLLAAVTLDVPIWGADAPNYLAFKAFLLTSGPATLSRLLPRLTGLMRPALEDHERDPNLRLNMLQLLDTLLEDPVRGPSIGGHHAAFVLRDLLIPPLIWRAGKVAAAVRFAACTALSTLLSKRLVPPEILMAAVSSGTLLPLIHQCLDEDWYTDVRNSSCFVMEQLLLLVGGAMTADQRRLVYPELLKRLDDSSNAVRIGACRALLAFGQTLTPEYCDTNSGYLAAGIIIHMDDSDPTVQEAACRALEALAAIKPSPVAAEVNKILPRFRSKHYCERVLSVCSST